MEEIKNANVNVTENENVKAEKPEGEVSVETPSVEELMAEIAELKATGQRNKNALDKALKEKGELTKTLRQRMTAEEAEAEAKREADEALKAELEAYRHKDKVREIEKQYLAMQYSEKDAAEVAEALANGDFETASRIQKNHQEEMMKSLKAEMIKQYQPTSPISNDEVQITQKEFDAMSYMEQVAFKNKYPDLWEKYAN